MNLKGINRYQTFGLRRDWLVSFFSRDCDKIDQFWISGELGNRQYDAMRIWLREAGITENNRATLLGLKMKNIGVHRPLTWAAIWTNLAYHSAIVRWYVEQIPTGSVNSRDDLIALLGEEYSRSTRENAVTSLLELMRHTLLGTDLGLGIVKYVGHKRRTVKSVEKAGWSEPDSLAVLYALYRYAEEMDGHYQFTMSELEERNGEAKGIDPMTLFGTDRDKIERIIRGLAEAHPDFIRADFMRDLDSIRLNSEKKSEDVFDLL